jgi:hypothetical protein
MSRSANLDHEPETRRKAIQLRVKATNEHFRHNFPNGILQTPKLDVYLVDPRRVNANVITSLGMFGIVAQIPVGQVAEHPLGYMLILALCAFAGDLMPTLP